MIPKANPRRDKSQKRSSSHETSELRSEPSARVEKLEAEIPLHKTDSLSAPPQKPRGKRELKQVADESLEQRMRRLASLEEEFPYLSM
jgi:hypothetical protein